MQTRPATVVRRPSTSRGPTLVAARGMPSAYPAGMRPDDGVGVGHVGVAVADALARGQALDESEARAHGHRGTQAEVVVDLGHRRQAVHRDARAHEVGVGRGVHEGRRAVGQVAQLGAAAGPLGDGDGLEEALLLGEDRRVLRARRRGRSAARCRRPARRPRPRAVATWRTRSSQAAPKAPPRPSPVSTLRCTRAVRPSARAAAAISSSTQGAEADRSMSRRTAPAKSAPGTESQRQQGCGHARVAQGEGLAELRHPEPRWPRPRPRCGRRAAARDRRRRP